VDRRGGYPVEDPRDRQRGHRRGGELDRGHRDRIPPGEQSRLRDDEPGGEYERRQHERVPGEGRRAATVRRDPGDAGQCHGEPGPRDRAHHAAAEPDRQQRDQDRRTPDEQGGVADAGPRDARVLQDDHDAVAECAPRDDRRRRRGAQPGPVAGPPADRREGHEQRRGQREPDDRQPTRVQPGEGELGQRHGGAPEQARRGERGKGEMTVGTHATNAPYRRLNV
jgi:hypothetical protein